MDAHLYAEIAVNRFNNQLTERLDYFIQNDDQLHLLYKKAEERYGKRVVNNILKDFLIKGLQDHKPIFFTEDPEYGMAEDLLEKTANRFISQMPDQVFLFIENDPELMDYLYQHPNNLREIQQNIREELMDLYHLIPTGITEDLPLSNLLNRYRRMMLKSEEEM